MTGLNAEQEETLQFVSVDHNLLITGQAGDGKSRLVTSIIHDCESRNLKVAVICSSGIVCTVYGSGMGPFILWPRNSRSTIQAYWKDRWQLLVL